MAKNVANRDDAKQNTHYLSALRYNRELMQSPDTCAYCPCYYYRKPWEEGSGGLHGQWDWGHQWWCLDQEVQSQLTRSLPFARTQLGPPLQLGAGGRFHWFQSGVCRTQYGFRLRASLPLPLVTEEPSISHLAVLQAGHPACCRWVLAFWTSLNRSSSLPLMVFVFRFVCWGRPPYKLSVCQQKYPDSSLSAGMSEITETQHMFFVFIPGLNKECHRNV